MSGIKGRSGGSNRKSIEELQLAGTLQNFRHGNIQSDKVEPLDDPWDSAEEVREGMKKYLEGNRTSRAQDHIYVEQFVDMYMMSIKCREVFQAEGPGAKVGSENALKMYQSLGKEMRMILSELRISPAVRERAFGSGEVKDELDDILGGIQ